VPSPAPGCPRVLADAVDSAVARRTSAGAPPSRGPSRLGARASPHVARGPSSPRPRGEAAAVTHDEPARAVRPADAPRARARREDVLPG